MSTYDSSTGTLLYFPDRKTLNLSEQAHQIAESAGLSFEPDVGSTIHNPIAWLDRTGEGVLHRLLPRLLRRKPVNPWGPIFWHDEAHREAALAIAETMAMSTKNRWFAVCDYSGWEEECSDLREHPTFAAFRSHVLNDRDTPDGPGGSIPEDGPVHKVSGPRWKPGDEA